MADKEVAKLIKQVEKMGWRVERKGHGYQIFPADKTQAPISVASTPSDHRWKANTIAKIRRAGGTI